MTGDPQPFKLIFPKGSSISWETELTLSSEMESLARVDVSKIT